MRRSFAPSQQAQLRASYSNGSTGTSNSNSNSSGRSNGRRSSAGGGGSSSGATDANGDVIIERLPLFSFLTIPDDLNKQFKIPEGCVVTEA